jgi:hypothetical protein
MMVNYEVMMTSLDSQDLRAVATAFALERQVLMPDLARSIEDKEKIAAGLLLCLSLAIGQTIAGVKIERIARIEPSGRNQGLIDFKLICRPPDLTQVELGICVLPFPDLELVNDAYNRLLVCKDFGINLLCLIRQGDLKTNLRQSPTWLPKLLSADIGGSLVSLKSQDVVGILTTLAVFAHKRQYGVTNQMIFTHVQTQQLVVNNDLIKNILTTTKF